MSATEADKTETKPQEGASAMAQHAVFISCAPEDQELAETISTHLKKRGLSSWYPLRDLREGEDQTAQIDEAIRSSKAMVVVFTDAANTSENVLREASVAIGSDIELVPFKLTRTLPVMGLEYYLSTVPWVDGTNKPLDTSAKGLAAAVCELIGTPSKENKLTALWNAAKTSDDMKDMPEMGVPVTIVIPEQGKWETESSTSGTQETAMVTDGVPVTIVYPEDGSWELKDEADAAGTSAAGPSAEASTAASSVTSEGAGNAAGSSDAAEGTSPQASAAESNAATVDSSSEDNAATNAGAANQEPPANETSEAPSESTEADGNSEDASEEVTVPKLEEELFSTSVAAVERIREMTKKDSEPAPLGDMVKVVLALLLAGAALIYLLFTSTLG